MYGKRSFPFRGAVQSATHHIEYSKSSRAKCRGNLCGGSLIGQGELRYGRTVTNDYGEILARNRGCVTPQILQRISSYGIHRVATFSSLRAEDQERVRLALKNGRVEPMDLTGSPSLSQPMSQPSTSSHLPVTQESVAGPSSKKRKADYAEAPSQIQNVAAPSPTQAAARHAAIGGAAWEEGVEAEEVRLVDAGEQVRLIREPNNRYDRNAIAVQNIGRTQVGHIPRQTAASLSPVIDAGLITVEGTMNEGNLRSFNYSLSVTLKIYGAANKRNQIEPMLRWAMSAQQNSAPRPSRSSVRSYEAASSYVSGTSDLSGNNSRSLGYGTQMPPLTAEALRMQQEEFARAAELKQMLANLEKVDDEGRRNSLLDTLCSTEDVLNLPEHPNPPGIATGELRVDLLRHQKQALQWAIEHENPKLPTKEEDKPVQFWQYRTTGTKAYYYNVVTKTPQETPPVLGRGALCGDSMGLGKTLTMISLILATKDEVSPEYSKSTLIVVPLSVLSNWEKQIQEHCEPDSLSYVTYYGATREMSAKELQKYDVVVTTYQTVVGGHNGSDEIAGKKRKIQTGSLFAVPWKRIVLDEGHNIRNPRTKMAQCVCALNAQRRWVLTGTPIDLGSILTFLRVCNPLDNPDFQTRLLLRPLKHGDPSGAELLRAIMSQICIRRTKEMQDSNGCYLVPLPGVEMTVVPVALDQEARELYDTVEQLSKERIEGFLKESSSPASLAFSTNALSMLTRLRQLVLHPGLIPSDYIDQLRSMDDDRDDCRIQITPEEKARLQSLLLQAIEDNEECPVCFGVLDDARITSCSHRFCLACIMEAIARDPRCPMDRRSLRVGDLIEHPPPTELTQAPIQDVEVDESTDLRTGSSAKIDQLLHLLRLTPENEKSLVFSQFTTFLDKIAKVLDKEGVPYVRFDGRMSAKRRQETLETFCVPIERDSPNVHSTLADPIPGVQQTGRSGRSSRRAGANDGKSRQVDSVSMNSDDDDGFVPQMDMDNDDIDDGSRTRSKRGKAKAKGKSKAVTRSHLAPLGGNASPILNGINPKVMLISLKAGALGLNLTVANNIYLWWQEGIESQAIDRCNRIGQKRTVHVYQLIAENTVEAKVCVRIALVDHDSDGPSPGSRYTGQKKEVDSRGILRHDKQGNTAPKERGKVARTCRTLRHTKPVLLNLT
ncbi:SNF2 family N-terminal domain-containing protein [Russula earlei]|uniref:SNF2 family N-terminal domain-containing protein n=1 Tax=Russula earlei TaxID=71964 RepID=A0ACC0TUJ2_9AGAM|nr:SNF2 family N-terminal domain-containing protein [Russula earlei]